LNEVDDTARRLPIEAGAIDCQAVVSLLAQKKYEGPVTMYPHPRSFRGQTRESIVQRASHALEDLWRGAGITKPKAAAAAAASAAAYEDS
jgi:sugar phosphate isomerase/epimerase